MFLMTSLPGNRSGVLWTAAAFVACDHHQARPSEPDQSMLKELLLHRSPTVLPVEEVP
jgi:hypothetical protein